jgi:hypothetical protein
MKAIVLALLGLSVVVGAQAQSGYLGFTNDVTSMVTNGLTGFPAVFTNTASIRVGLYYAPDGVTDEGAFSFLTNAAVGQVGPGRYAGGTRAIPGAVAGQAVMIQVRGYETNYGNSYEACLIAPPNNGRRALVGKSEIARVVLATNGPFVPKVGPLVKGFSVYPLDGPPAVTANDIAVAEGTNGTAFATFAIRLPGGAATNEISVDYATADGTALAGSDYVATSGTATFAPGETVKNVVVTLLPDATVEPQETFSLGLSNPQGGTLLRSTIVCTIVELRITSVSVDTVLTFTTLAGRRYLVEKSGDGVNWIPVAGATNLLASGTSLTATDKGNGCEGMSLFRVNLLP